MIIYASFIASTMHHIDFIEIDGKFLNWEYSEYYLENGRVYAKLKGVYIGEEAANGRLEELKNCKGINNIQFYSRDEETEVFNAFPLLSLEIVDDGCEYSFSKKQLKYLAA